MSLFITEKIKSIIKEQKYTTDNIGMSGSTVMIFDDYVLKIEKHTEAVRRTAEIMKWLDGKVPVPKVIHYECVGEMSYLLMSKVIGKMSCDEYYLENSDTLVTLLADGLKMLWNVSTEDCPVIRDIDAELAEARYRVRNNLVDTDNVEPETFGKDGFESPGHLLSWLEENRPDYEPVLSHGDFCLPNVFIENEKISGFIDLGDMGVGDKWRDIALCYRSLKHNFDGSYGGKIYPDFSADLLFEKLGIEKNEKKLKYYLLLDELF